MRWRSGFLFVFLIFIIIQPASSVSAQPPSPDIQVSPSTITIKLTKKFLGSLTEVSEITLNVRLLNQSVTVADVFADNFFEEQDRNLPISSKALTFTVNQSNFSEYPRVEIQLNFKLPPTQRPGSYSSKIYVTSSSGYTVEIPFTLVVSASEYRMGLWILGGVILNLILFGIKDIIEERNRLTEVLDTVEKGIQAAYDAVRQAYTDGRYDDLESSSNYGLAKQELTYLIMDWDKAIESKKLGNVFTRLGKRGERVVKLAEKARETSIDLIKKRMHDLKKLEPPTDPYLKKKKPEERLKIHPLRDSVVRSRTLQYLALAITFGVVVVHSWNTYLSDVIAFGASGLADNIAALLFGFGSQTVLTQGVGLARSWAEARSTQT